MAVEHVNELNSIVEDSELCIDKINTIGSELHDPTSGKVPPEEAAGKAQETHKIGVNPDEARMYDSDDDANDADADGDGGRRRRRRQ